MGNGSASQVLLTSASEKEADGEVALGSCMGEKHWLQLSLWGKELFLCLNSRESNLVV